MVKQRIYVQVVGFNDVERHALNTVFRLSEERELSYAPWIPLTAPGVQAPTRLAEVALVDGDCAEAVLSHARETPAGQRLIWIGPNAPAHAWRVLGRPIQWAAMLNDLDAVFAARQIDSGFLDLHVTQPGALEPDSGLQNKRALVVGAAAERGQLAAWLAGVGVSDVDAADSTETALECIGRHRYVCGVFDLDEHHVDTWQLARLFAQHNFGALTVGVSEHADPLAPWLNRRRLKRDTQRTGINALVGRPLQEAGLRRWLDLLA